MWKGYRLLFRLDDAPKFAVFEQPGAREPVTAGQEREIIGFRTRVHDEFPGHTYAQWRQPRYVHFRVVGQRRFLEERRHGRDVVAAGHKRLQHRVHDVPVTPGRHRQQSQYSSAIYVTVSPQRQRAHRPPNGVHRTEYYTIYSYKTILRN